MRMKKRHQDIDLNELKLTDTLYIIKENKKVFEKTIEDCFSEAFDLNTIPLIASAHVVKVKRDNIIYDIYDLCKATDAKKLEHLHLDKVRNTDVLTFSNRIDGELIQEADMPYFNIMNGEKVSRIKKDFALAIGGNSYDAKTVHEVKMFFEEKMRIVLQRYDAKIIRKDKEYILYE